MQIPINSVKEQSNFKLYNEVKICTSTHVLIQVKPTMDTSNLFAHFPSDSETTSFKDKTVGNVFSHRLVKHYK